jgi:hypothetical protein
VANETPKEDSTVWRVLILLDGGLASVVGTSPHPRWMFESMNAEIEGDLEARFLPLSEVTGLHGHADLSSTGLRIPGRHAGMPNPVGRDPRDGLSLEIPWRDAGDALNPHELFAHDLIALLNTR